MDQKNKPFEGQSLEEKLAHYKQLVEETPLCIKIFDNTGKATFINDACKKEYFIKDNDNINNLDWLSSIKEEYRPLALEAFKNGLEGKTSRIDFEHTPGESGHQWCEGLIAPIKDAQGKVTELLFYSIDATEKKATELKLAQKTKDLQARNEELENMNSLMVDRELKMVELKQKIKELEEKLNTRND